jgi:hypothetical protein
MPDFTISYNSLEEIWLQESASPSRDMGTSPPETVSNTMFEDEPTWTYLWRVSGGEVPVVRRLLGTEPIESCWNPPEAG